MKSPTTSLRCLCLILVLVLLTQLQTRTEAQEWEPGPSPYGEENHQIRRDKFDVILPQVMRERGIDMWIHVMREAVPDSFGRDELGSESGVFIFTDRGGDRIERAIVGRRWGATQREYGGSDYKLVEESGAYDIISDPIRVQEPLTGPLTEFDYRFKGLKEFVTQRDPQRIAVNFLHDLGSWPTDRGRPDGISHTDYLLLADELGDEYADRLVSSEYLILDYITRKVPSEIELMKRMRQDDLARLERIFAAIEPGVTTLDDSQVTVFRRMGTGQSQRGRSAGWENAVVQGGDILAAPGLGTYAYVLREGETAPPEEIQRLWAEYLRVDEILADTIRAGLTPRQIIRNYERRFDEAGIVVRADQLHMVLPKNDFPAYVTGFDAGKTHLTIDAHGQMKGARPWSDETYHAPRIGSYGPSWTKDIPLSPNHHFVIEYFFYMPSPGPEGTDQYLLWWDHEEALATEDGIEYLSPPQKELILIPSSQRPEQTGEYRIVFSSERDGNPEIYSMNQDGSGVVRLTDDPGNDSLPYCSPDGSQVVFASDRDGVRQLYLIDIDGDNLTRLTDNELSSGSPSWSPDGSMIAFSSGGNATASNLYTIEPDGSNQRQVTDIAGYNFLSPTWSPDGSRLAAEGGLLGETIETEWGEAGRMQIWTFNADGSDPVQLTKLDAYNGYPAWSPTGSTIVFDSTLEGWADILSVNTGDLSVANLTQDPLENEFAAWSPDGASIAFVAGRDGNNEIYVMDADGESPTRLTHHEAADTGPAWCRR